MSNPEKVESLFAEAKRLSVNPNALAASGLQVRVERAPYESGFGDNPFPKMAERWSVAIFRAMVENSGSKSSM